MTPYGTIAPDSVPTPVSGNSLALHDALWSGAPNWKDDKELTAAGVILTSPRQPLCELLRLDQRFERVYEDRVAVVFIPRNLAQRNHNQPTEVSQLTK